MAVVPFPMDLSPQGPSPRMSWELRSLTARHMSPLSGVATTLERPGAHWAAQLPYENLADDRRARFQTLAASLRGHANRTYVPVFGWTRRGSFPATELLANNYFSSASGWSVTTTGATLSVSDGIARWMKPGASGSTLIPSTNPLTLTQYAPYVARFVATYGPGNLGGIDARVGATSGASEYLLSSTLTTDGIKIAAGVPYAASGHFALAAGGTSSVFDAAHISYVSLARCALVDNSPNLLLRSDEIDNAAWTKSAATSGADVTTDPNGTTTADSIVEDTNNTSHYARQDVTVASSVLDYAFGVAVRSNGRDFCWLQLDELTGTTSLTQYFGLTGGGSVGTGATGANWASRRAFVVDLGGGWVYCGLVGRKTNAATSIRCYIGTATADGTGSYLGDGSSGITAWRATMAQSSVPTRLRQTTSALTAGTSQTGGALYLKGLPASASGLLLQGDPAQIVIGTTSQLVRTRGSLNSDAAGRGYWEFEPPLRVSPSDNAAVIVQNPLCKMMADSNNVGWTDRAAGFSDLELSFVEDTFPS